MFSKKIIVLCLFLIVGGLICAGTVSAHNSNTTDHMVDNEKIVKDVGELSHDIPKSIGKEYYNSVDEYLEFINDLRTKYTKPAVDYYILYHPLIDIKDKNGSIVTDFNPAINTTSEFANKERWEKCAEELKKKRNITLNDPYPMYIGSTHIPIDEKQLKDFSKKNDSVSKVKGKVVNKVSVSAPVVKNNFKKSAFFKMNLKDSKNKVLKNVKLNVKVFTGKKYKNFKVKTNSKGVAKLNTKSLKKGVHKVIINSLNKKYNINKKGNLIIIK